MPLLVEHLISTPSLLETDQEYQPLDALLSALHTLAMIRDSISDASMPKYDAISPALISVTQSPVFVIWSLV